MTRTFVQRLRTVVQGRSANLASSTNATPIVATRTAASTINVASASNTTPIVIGTATAHGLRNGDFVTIASVGGNTNANANCYVLVVDSFTFQIFDTSFNPIAGNAAYTSGGTVTPWLFQDGDWVTVASHAVNTNANGTWATSSSSATVQTLIGRNDATNSVGNGVGTASGTVTHAGQVFSPSLDISGLSNLNPSLRIRVRSLDAGAKVMFSVHDSVDSFANWVPNGSRVVQGGISKSAMWEDTIPYRELIRVRFGTASAKLRLHTVVDTGAAVEFDAFLEY